MSRSKKDGIHSGGHHRSKCCVCQNKKAYDCEVPHLEKAKIKLALDEIKATKEKLDNHCQCADTEEVRPGAEEESCS